MKNHIITLLLLISTSLFSNELSWVDEQVEAIKPARSGMKSRDISKVKDPFIFLLKNKNEEDIAKIESTVAKAPSNTVIVSTNKKTPKVKSVNKILALGVIMNNSAMISGDWYKVGDLVNGYTVSNISAKNVLLSKNKKELLLSTKSISKKLKFQK